MALGHGNKTIGYWMSDKKVQKLDMCTLKQLCKEKGYHLVKIDLNRPLNEQGPFCIIFHKCTDIIVKANSGDQKSQEMIRRLEKFLVGNPSVPIVDPLENVGHVLNRYKSYIAIRDNQRLSASNIFTPTSVELLSSDPAVNLATLKAAGVKYPFICKPSVAHGCEAHEMAIIFNDDCVADCRPPAVAQTFINHNALLYKVFCVGEQYVCVERPSLKNFYHYENEKTIFFLSTDVSRQDSTSSLTRLDGDDPMKNAGTAPLDTDRIKLIVKTIRDDIGLQLMGIDVVVDNSTGSYAVIDINAFPGYDGFPNLWESVLLCLEKTMTEHEKRCTGTLVTPDATSPTGDHDDSGFDTSDSSDEKKRQLSSPR